MDNDFSWTTFNEQNSGHQALRSFLMLDIQNYPNEIEALLVAIGQIQQGKRTQWQGGGNAYFCELTAKGAQLEMAMDDIDDSDIPPITLDCCLEAATAWLAHCRSI